MSAPLRMCVVCRQMKDKRSLLRVVRNKDGDILYDSTGKASGRGAYVCADRACFDKLSKVRGFERSLKCAVPQEVFEAVGKVLEE